MATKGIGPPRAHRFFHLRLLSLLRIEIHLLTLTARTDGVSACQDFVFLFAKPLGP